MTYSAAVQLDNETDLELVSGKITYFTGDVVAETLKNMFRQSTSKASGRFTTVSGTLDISTRAYRTAAIQFSEGENPIAFDLIFSNGDSFSFSVPLRTVLEPIEKPLWCPVVFAKGSTPPNKALGVQLWTRHDSGITGQYPDGLITFTLVDRSRTARWMQLMKKPQTTPLNELTLPGTHDTGTWTMGSTSKCQSMTLREQLDRGIRFIDIRLEPMFDSRLNVKLWVYHGSSSSDLEFRKDVIRPCLDFLNVNPGETIIMLVNRNDLRLLPIDDAAFEAAVKRDLGTSKSRIISGQNMPTLDRARRNIVLAARHPNIGGIQLVKGWPADNCGTLTTGTGAGALTVEIQDVYKFDPLHSEQASINDKWAFVRKYLEKARTSAPGGKWFINYTSASALGSLNPWEMAEGLPGITGVNTMLYLYLKHRPKGCFGTVPMDFPQLVNIENLIDSNN